MRQESVTKRLSFRRGTPEDAAELSALHSAVADHLTSRWSRGLWSSHTSEKGVQYAMCHSRVLVVASQSVIKVTICY